MVQDPAGRRQRRHRPGPEAGRALVAHPDVAKVSFTGSTETGRSILRDVAGRLAPALMELGGKGPMVVCPDADLDTVTEDVLTGIFAAYGDLCFAASRLLVHRTVHDELLDRVSERAERIVVGGAYLRPPCSPRPTAARAPRGRSSLGRCSPSSSGTTRTTRSSEPTGCRTGWRTASGAPTWRRRCGSPTAWTPGWCGSTHGSRPPSGSRRAASRRAGSAVRVPLPPSASTRRPQPPAGGAGRQPGRRLRHAGRGARPRPHDGEGEPRAAAAGGRPVITATLTGLGAVTVTTSEGANA